MLFNWECFSCMVVTMATANMFSCRGISFLLHGFNWNTFIVVAMATASYVAYLYCCYIHGISLSLCPQLASYMYLGVAVYFIHARFCLLMWIEGIKGGKQQKYIHHSRGPPACSGVCVESHVCKRHKYCLFNSQTPV